MANLSIYVLPDDVFPSITVVNVSGWADDEWLIGIFSHWNGEYFLEAATSTAISQVALLQEARRKYPALFYSHTLKVDYI